MVLSAMRRWLNCKGVKMNKKDRDEFKRKDTDPLLALAGTWECDVTEIRKHLKILSIQRYAVVKGPYEDHPDPLIALLERWSLMLMTSGERHDDYIADALLAELWGDSNE